jgi:hypothetical protein
LTTQPSVPNGRSLQDADDGTVIGLPDSDIDQGASARTKKGWLFHAPFNEWLGGFVQLGTVLTVLAYGYGWIICGLFFSHFDLSPEDVGIAFNWLAIRAFLITVVVSIAALIVRFIYQRSERYGSIVQIIESRLALLMIRLLFALIAGAAVDFSAKVDGWHIFIAPISLMVITGLYSWISPARERIKIGWNAKILLRAMAASLAGFTIILLAALPYEISSRLARDVAAGQAIQLQILPGVRAFEIDRVRVYFFNNNQSISVATPVSSTTGICLLRLGGNGFDSDFYNPLSKRVLTINDQNIVTSNSC